MSEYWASNGNLEAYNLAEETLSLALVAKMEKGNEIGESRSEEGDDRCKLVERLFGFFSSL